MKIQEGPAMGALFIGGGLGFLIYQKYQNALYAGLIGVGVGVADYIVVVWAQRFKTKKK